MIIFDAIIDKFIQFAIIYNIYINLINLYVDRINYFTLQQDIPNVWILASDFLRLEMELLWNYLRCDHAKRLNSPCLS